MAKKGGVQQLQADINTDEEFEKFLERPGLLVMDVYTEWCGPCIGMLGALKKIKLELGGDNLQLAVCKADTIEALKRFRNKSEPTWLFASNRKAINILFGTNVPALINLITLELDNEANYRAGKFKRHFYKITDLQPIEMVKVKIRQQQEKEAKIAEAEVAVRKRKDYLTYVTDTIMENITDSGVTMYMPHISRDMFKKLMDPADAQKLTCKDRRVAQITLEDLELLHFGCENPLDLEIWEQIFGKDILCCFWKMGEGDKRDIENVIADYVYELIKRVPVLDENGEPKPDTFKPSILKSLDVTVQIKIEKPKPECNEVDENNVDEMENDDENEDEDDDLEVDNPEGDESTKDNGDGGEDETKEKPPAEEPPPEEEPDEFIEKVITIPPVWAPGTKRSNAAAIYLLFRPQTTAFLPPDPIPDPPHLAMAFEAYKRKDIQEVCDKYVEFILLYGYFTSADPDTTKLIANSTAKYEKRPPQVTDKLVLKVARKDGEAVLALAAHNPTYVSPNTVVGEEDCLKFFPQGYKTGEMEEIEKKLSLSQKKKKKKKKKQAEEDAVPEEAQEAAPDAPEAEDEAEADENIDGEGGEDDGDGDENDESQDDLDAGDQPAE